MDPAIDKNAYDLALISKVKENTRPKKLKKITQYLRNLSKEDINEFSELKIKILDEKGEEIKKPEFKIIAPVIGTQHYFESLIKLNSNHIVNNEVDLEGKNTPSVVDNIEVKEEQLDSSDFSGDE